VVSTRESCGDLVPADVRLRIAVEQQERRPVAAMAKENLRAVGANPPGLEARKQAAVGRQWPPCGLRQGIAGRRNERRPQSRRSGGDELSAIDHHGTTLRSTRRRSEAASADYCRHPALVNIRSGPISSGVSGG
jgi:hypothetical protein